jgi:hypothetical protein
MPEGATPERPEGPARSPARPVLRASDADREHGAELLRAAAGEGRLTVDELDERLQSAYAAKTQLELQELVADVVPSAGHGLPLPAHGAGRVAVRPGPGGARWLVAIMSGLERRGHWRLADGCTSLNIMGGSDLDLNDVELAGDDVELRVFCLMGGSDIYVPEHLNVEVSDFAFMGGNDIAIGDPRPDPGGPLLRLTLVSIMGGIDVKRGRKRTRQERRRERRLAREGAGRDRHTGH